MAIEVAVLKARVEADTRDAEAGLSRVDKQLHGLATSSGGATGKVSGLGGALGALGSVGTVAMLGLGGALVGLGAGLASSIGQAATFESAIAGVGALVGATADELLVLSAAALALGQDISLSGIGATDAAAAMEQLAAAGFSVAEMTAGATRGVLLLASATGTDVASAARIAGDAFNAFRQSMGLTAADMPRISNLFVGAANVSSIGLTDIGESMKYIGPLAAAMGISIEDVTATIAALGNQGIKGSQAGTALRSVLASLAKPSKEAQQVIKGLGLEFFDAGGSMKDFSGISGELKTKLAGLTDQQRASALVTLFGNEALSAATVMYGEGSEGIQQYIKDIAAQGDAAAIGAKRNDTFKGSVQALGGAWETAQIALGQVFLPALKDLAGWAARGVSAAIPLIQAWGPQLIAGISAAIGVVRTFGGYIASAVGAIIGAWQQLQAGEITLAQFIGGIKIMIATVLGDLGGLLGQAGDILGPFLGKVGAAITTALPIIGAELLKLGQRFGGWVMGTALPVVLTQLGEWKGAVGLWITGTAIPAITTFLVGVGTAFGDWVALKAIPWVQEKLPEWVAAITTWITTTALPALTTGVEQLAAALVSWIKGEPATTAFGAWLKVITQALADGLGLLAEFGKIALPRLSEWIKSEETQTKFGELLTAIGIGTADILNALNEFSGQAGVDLNTWLQESGPKWLVSWTELYRVTDEGSLKIAALIESFEQEAFNSLTAWLNSMLPPWLHTWDALATAVKEKLAEAVGYVKAFPGEAKDALGNMGTVLYQAGIDLVQGFVNGILDKLPSVGGAGAQLAAAVAGALKGGLQERSPSKLTQVMGRDFVQGLIVGMDEKQGEAAAKAASVAAAVATAFLHIFAGSSAQASGVAADMVAGIGALGPKVQGVAADMVAGIGALGAKIQGVAADMVAGIAALGAKTTGVASDMAAGIGALGPKVQGVAADMVAGIGALGAKIQSVASDMTTGIGALGAKTTGVAADMVAGIGALGAKTTGVAADMVAGIGALGPKVQSVASDMVAGIGALGPKVQGVAADMVAGIGALGAKIQGVAADMVAGIGALGAKTTGVAADMVAGIGALGPLAVATETAAKTLTGRTLPESITVRDTSTQVVTVVAAALNVWTTLTQYKDLPTTALAGIQAALVDTLGIAAAITAQSDALKAESYAFLANMEQAGRNYTTGLGLGQGLGGGVLSLPALSSPVKQWTFDMPTLPKLAEGGLVTRPTLALVGERGPEAVIPLAQLGRYGGGGGGGQTVVVNYHYHDHSPTADRSRLADFARQLQPELARLTPTLMGA